jgi:hypothetical protein
LNSVFKCFELILNVVSLISFYAVHLLIVMRSKFYPPKNPPLLPHEPERLELLVPSEREPLRLTFVETRPNPLGLVLPTPANPPVVREAKEVGRRTG